jgi:hypothetical protein
MNPAPYRDYLRLLSVFHYVVAGLAGLASLLPVVYMAVGLAILGTATHGGPPDPMGRAIALIFVTVAAGLLAGALTLTVCIGLAGRYLAGHSHYTFCLVMAAVECVFMPFGTVLGVLTLITLLQEPAKVLFGEPVTVAAG